jgi:hypothetical protein
MGGGREKEQYSHFRQRHAIKYQGTLLTRAFPFIAELRFPFFPLVKDGK